MGDISAIFGTVSAVAAALATFYAARSANETANSAKAAKAAVKEAEKMRIATVSMDQENKRLAADWQATERHTRERERREDAKARQHERDEDAQAAQQARDEAAAERERERQERRDEREAERLARQEEQARLITPCGWVDQVASGQRVPKVTVTNHSQQAVYNISIALWPEHSPGRESYPRNQTPRKRLHMPMLLPSESRTLELEGRHLSHQKKHYDGDFQHQVEWFERCARFTIAFRDPYQQRWVVLPDGTAERIDGRQHLPDRYRSGN